MGMDKALFRAYIKEIVKEQIEDSVEKAVKKILPEILTEAIADIKRSQGVVTESAVPSKRPMVDRSRLAEMMGLERLGDTISAHTGNMEVPNAALVPPELRSNPAAQEAIEAVTKDYSKMMKAMGLSK